MFKVVLIKSPQAICLIICMSLHEKHALVNGAQVFRDMIWISHGKGLALTFQKGEINSGCR